MIKQKKDTSKNHSVQVFKVAVLCVGVREGSMLVVRVCVGVCVCVYVCMYNDV